MSPWMSGGIAVHVAELAQTLARVHRLKAVTPGPHRGAVRQGSVDVAIAREFPVRPLPPFEFFPELLRSLIHLRDVDILHLHDPRLVVDGPILRKPLVTTFHGYLPLEAAINTGTRPGRPLFEFYDFLVQTAVRSSQALIAVDNRIAAWLRRSYLAQEVSVIPNGVDTVKFRPRESGGELRRKWGIPPGAQVILAAKHFVPKNGLDVLVRSMEEIVAHLPNAHLVLAGHGDLEGTLRQTVTHLRLSDHVTLVGQLPHDLMPEALAACDVCAIPSVGISGVEEATSILALEAMASARPVVASDIGGLREILRDGVTGRLVAPGDVKALADAIIAVLREPESHEQMGRRAREHVSARHSWSTIGQLTESVYFRALSSYRM